MDRDCDAGCQDRKSFYPRLLKGHYMFLKIAQTVCEVWQRFKEYEEMKSRGFILMKSENGDDFWVGYGD